MIKRAMENLKTGLSNNLFFGLKQLFKELSLNFKVLILFVSLTSLSSRAQEIDITENFIHFSNKDGLPNSIIRSIKQDVYGFLWLATEDGACRFDGYEFKTYRYDNNNPKSLPDNFTYSLCPTKDGGMLVGTNVGGFAKYNAATDNFTVYKANPETPNSLSNNKVMAVFEDRSGNYWIGTHGGGLNFYDVKSDSFKVYQHDANIPNSIYNNNIFGIIEDLNGFIWVRTTENLCKLDPESGKFTHYDLPGTAEIDRMNENMIIDEEGIIWMGWNFQLVKFDTKNSKLEFATIISSVKPLSEILSLCIHDNNHLWLATTSGIHLYNKKDFNVQSFYADPKNELALQNDYSNAIYKDRSGVLWCSGLSKLNLNTKQFKHYRLNVEDPESLGGGRVRAMLVDHKGNYWISAVNALAIMEPQNKTTKYYSVINNDPTAEFNASPISFMEDKDNNIWVGLWGTGITILEKGNLKKFTKITPHLGVEGALQNGIVQALFQDSYGNIWVGNENGIDLYNPDTKEFKHLMNDPQNNNSLTPYGVQANCILEDTYGNIWVGTWGGLTKITLLNPEKGSYYSDLNYKQYTNQSNDNSILSDSRVISIMYDADKYPNKIFAGTFGGGVNIVHFNNETGKDSITSYTSNDGLSNNVVYGILSDPDGNIWMSTNNGLSNLNPITKQFQQYNVEDGLQDNAFYWGAYTKGMHNELLFGGINGFNEFNANEIKNDSIPPVVVFVDFKVLNKTILSNQKVNDHVILNKPINNTDTIVLTYKENVFSFKFAGLHYAFPHDNQYMYKMEGFDKEWITVDANIRMATYTNLDPDKYVFKVKASNYDGIWNQKAKEVVIIIKPPFWQTIWFRSILIIAIIIILFSFYIIRIKALKARQKHLEEEVDKRTNDLQLANKELEEQKDEILEQNEEIQQQSEELKTQRDSLEEKNNMISVAYKRIEMLSEFGQKLTSTLSISNINDMMYNYVTNLIDIHAFGIGIFNARKKQIVFSNFIEEGKTIKTFYKSINDKNSLVAYSFNKQEALYISNIEEEYSKYVEELNETSTSQTAFSRIHIPLTVEDKQIGIFIINNYEPNAYTSDDFANLKTLASYISIALDNANAYKQINDINLRVQESINYAQSIQNAFLPTKMVLDKYIKNFVLFRPKDVVSGDFYWFSPIEKDETKPLKAFIAVADCTGHGVPGALISIIGNNLLNEIVNIRKIYNTAQILEFLNVEFQLALNQDVTRNNDGMDIVICYIEEIVSKTGGEPEFKVNFSGAKNPCIVYHSNKNEIESIKGSRKSIGGLRAKRSTQFYENIELNLKKNDILYLSTDGFIDQHSPERIRFSRESLMNELNNACKLDLDRQKELLEKVLDKHQDNEKQTDDITLIGIKL